MATVGIFILHSIQQQNKITCAASCFLSILDIPKNYYNNNLFRKKIGGEIVSKLINASSVDLLS